ncbi:MAG: hypothetical protein WAV11_00230 [Minisyncoccia bacterium]
MKNKLLIIGTTLIIFLAVILGIRFFSGEDNWLCKDGQWIKHGQPSSEMPLVGCGDISEQNKLPDGYTLNSYKITEILNKSCQKDTECETPGDYLIRSNCPYTSLCLEKKCTVVCPTQTQNSVSSSTLIGGDRDEHGCLGPAGYSWCPAKQKCLRVWEETCEVKAVEPKCELENCHGLDIKCGANPPEICNEMYGIGDRCLQYAKCGIQNGSCQQIQNSQFTQCKSCVQKCVDTNSGDIIKAFECESKCN